MTRLRTAVLVSVLVVSMPGVLATALLLVLGAPHEVVSVASLVIAALGALLLLLAAPPSKDR